MIRRAWPTMGSMASLAVSRSSGADEHAVDRVVGVVRDWFDEVEAALSPYRRDSDLCRWRAGELALDDSRHLFEMLQACDSLARVTEGGFHPYDRSRRFDPTGYAKGWAIERGLDVFVSAGITDACLGIGGDQQMIGRAQPTRPWRVAVADTSERGRIAAVVSAPASGARFAVATSGEAERGEHIWPAGGRPLVVGQLQHGAGLASVTVVGPLLGLADAFATAIWAHARTSPLDEAWRWLAGTGYEALAVDRLGRVRGTAGMPGQLVRPAAA
jgi:thiamine biosynthesis lipoprotein